MFFWLGRGRLPRRIRRPELGPGKVRVSYFSYFSLLEKTIFTCGDSRQVKESFQLLLLLLGGGDVFVRPLDDLVAKSRNNNLGRYYNFKKPDLQKFLRVTNQFCENHPKRFKLQI